MEIQLWPYIEPVPDFFEPTDSAYIKHSWRPITTEVNSLFSHKCTKCGCLTKVERKGTRCITIYKLWKEKETSKRPNCIH